MKSMGLSREMAFEDMDITLFKNLLLRSCGHSFEREREQSLTNGLSRRMETLGIDTYEAYYSLLLGNPDELLRLTELLTVNETYFFREPDHLRLLIDTLLPELMETRKNRPIRILSTGCSTGEEPYTIAIMLRERFGSESEKLFTVTGVDIDSTVIASAREGIYGKGSFRGIDRSLLERYFEPRGSDRFQIIDSVRKQVRFEVVNLLGLTYPQEMQMPDIILYRNVSIYFPQQVQKEIFSKLANILADDGCLLVSSSETILHDIGILTLVKQDSLFYYRKTPMPIINDRRMSSRSSTPERSKGGSLKVIPVNVKIPEANRNRTPASKKPDVGELFNSAIETAQNKQYDKALEILDAVIEQDSTFVKAYCLKGSLLLSIFRFNEASLVCESILWRDQLCLEPYIMLGIIARQKEDNYEAIKRFREAIYLNTFCWPAHFYSAEIYFAQNDPKRARKSYESAIRILEKGSLAAHGHDFFPLSFNAEQFLLVCRHKLSLLKEQR